MKQKTIKTSTLKQYLKINIKNPYQVLLPEVQNNVQNETKND